MLSDYQFWTGALAVLVASYGAYYQRKQYNLMLPPPGKRSTKPPPSPWWKYPPLIATFALAALAWVPLAVSFWNRPAIPTIGLAGWGTTDPLNGLPIGITITKDDPSMRLMGIAYHYDSTVDVYDVARLQKSALYDVRVSTFAIMIKPDQTFMDEVTSHRHVRTNYLLLSVPSSLANPEFSTLRQATNMGIKIIWSGVGPP